MCTLKSSVGLAGGYGGSPRCVIMVPMRRWAACVDEIHRLAVRCIQIRLSPLIGALGDVTCYDQAKLGDETLNGDQPLSVVGVIDTFIGACWCGFDLLTEYLCPHVPWEHPFLI